MQILFKQLENPTIYQTLEDHLAWKGRIRGLDADKMLRGKKTPFLYILRAGEIESESEDERNFYVSFVEADFSITHVPFIVKSLDSGRGWCYENGDPCGPFTNHHNIDDVIHLIMHVSKDSPKPLIA